MKQQPSPEWTRRVSIGRSLLIHKSPILATLLFSMDVMCDDKLGTAYTDCVRYIGIPDGFAFEYPDTDYAFILAHEVAHKLLVHDEMAKTLKMKDHRLANVAQDFVINRMVISGEGIKLSDNWHRASLREFVDVNLSKSKPTEQNIVLFDPTLDGKTSWEIYEMLVNELGENGGSSASFNGIAGEDAVPGGDPDEGGSPIDGLSQTDLDKIRQDVVGAITEGMRERGQQIGSMSGDWQRIFQGNHDPKIDWAQVLEEFVTTFIGYGATPTYTRLNRRVLPMGVYSPGYKGERVGRLAVIVDTSGSIGNEELNMVQEELSSLLDRKQLEAIDIIYADAQVCHTHTINPGDTLKLEPKGGGGTDFRPAFKWIDAQHHDYQCAIYFTDGYGAFPEEPDLPTLWVRFPGYSIASGEFPFGEVVDMEAI